MASFSEGSFSKKLSDLNLSQQSIQTLSLWLIHHRKHAKSIAKIWFNELKKTHHSRLLLFFYLLNDVLQNSRKKGTEFHEAFSTILYEALKYSLSRVDDDKIKGSFNRLTTIWSERGVFSAEFMITLKAVFVSGEKEGVKREKESVKREKESVKQEPKKRTKQKENKEKEPSSKKKDPSEPPSKKKKQDVSLWKEIESDLQKAALLDPPSIDELIRSIADLENAASFDAGVREQIAALPPEVSDTSALAEIQDRDSADQLIRKVNGAVSLLTDYNQRLQAELADRRQMAVKLRCFIDNQRQMLEQDQKLLEVYKGKLNKITDVRQELQSHIKSLPDLSLLPTLTKGLAPLPSAGDLFNQ